MPLADVDRAVRERYTEGAREPAADLCCPVEYDPKYLSAIPPEVLERDYGCGFYGMRIRERHGNPWRTVEGIEFRSTTVEAFKGKELDCRRDTIRHPWETKGEDYRVTTDGPSCCEPGNCC